MIGKPDAALPEGEGGPSEPAPPAGDGPGAAPHEEPVPRAAPDLPPGALPPEAETSSGAAAQPPPGPGPETAPAAAVGMARGGNAAPAGSGQPGGPLAGPQRESAARPPAAPFLLAGVLTAALGFAAAWYLWRPGGPFSPDAALTGARLDGLETRLATVEKGLADAASGLDGKAGKPELAALASDVAARADAADKAAAAARTEVQALAGRLDELAARPPDTDPDARAAYQRELVAMRQMIEDEISRIRAESQAAAADMRKADEARTRAEIAAALAALEQAVAAGTDLVRPLDTLGALDPALPVAALRPYAEGVPTLSTLQAGFPAAARAALAAASVSGDAEPGLWGALKGQLGVRSLAPQPGGSADAVLSRAEAALRGGDLGECLRELDALPVAAAAAMDAWRGAAERRQAALSALQAISSAVES